MILTHRPFPLIKSIIFSTLFWDFLPIQFEVNEFGQNFGRNFELLGHIFIRNIWSPWKQYWTGLKCVSFIEKPNCTKIEQNVPSMLWRYKTKPSVASLVDFQEKMFQTNPNFVDRNLEKLNVSIIKTFRAFSNTICC